MPKGTQCSGDLRSVLDAAGNIVATCAADQGCEAGACVPACQAAAQGHGSVGCDFLVATPAFATLSTPPCFAVFVANNGQAPVALGVERAGQSFDVTTFGRVPSQDNDPAQWPTVLREAMRTCVCARRPRPMAVGAIRAINWCRRCRRSVANLGLALETERLE